MPEPAWAMANSRAVSNGNVMLGSEDACMSDKAKAVVAHHPGFLMAAAFPIVALIFNVIVGEEPIARGLRREGALPL